MCDTDENPQFPEVNNSSKCAFQIKEIKLYVIVVTLLTEDGNEFLEQLKTGIKRTIK